MGAFRQKSLLLVLTAAVIGISTGCGGAKPATPGNASDSTAPPVSTEPVSLKLFFYQPGFNSADFTEKFQPLLQKKFPNITYELMDPQAGATLSDQVGAGNVPDIIFAGEHELKSLSSLDIPEDLTSWAKKYKIDMTKYDPTLVNSIKKYSDKGETLSLGYAMQYYATFYNKDIFDKFGVAYPKDGLGWNDLIEIAKKLTRNEDGVQYFGMIAGGAAALAQSWGLSQVDDKTQKSSINTDGWKQVFELGKQIYGIPGNMPTAAKMAIAAKDFTGDKNVGVIPWYGDTMINSLEALQKAGTPMNWDMVTYPVRPEAPGKSHEISFRSLVLSKTSKHKEQAMQVMQYLSTSDETQTMLSRVGFGPALKDVKFQQVFGADREVLKGKNVQAIFKTTPLEIHQPSDLESYTTKAINTAFSDYLAGNGDLNTIMQKAQDTADKAIADGK